MLYAITDIETTGGNAKKEKITEIAIYIFDGEKVIDQITTLINPEQTIPYYIQQLTGITNEMVQGAPKFYEIAKDIVKLTENCIFVAHNAAFDYNFIKEEFKSLGFDYERQNLCTVKLSRKLLPGHGSYSLGILSASLGIEVQNRHRASGDALATVELFKILLEKTGNEDISDLEIADILKGLNKNLDKAILKNLPETTGVYYFMDEDHTPLYIGKSINIKKRILSHFSNKSAKKTQMKANTCYIDYEKTGSELVALLYEASEVKHHKPLYNRLLRKNSFNWGLYSFIDENDFINLELKRNTLKDGNALLLFKNKKEGENFLHKQIEIYNLCQNLCGVYKSENGCFHYQINMCKGACVGKESPSNYNVRVNKLIENTAIPANNFFIIDQGRSMSEKGIVKIENGIYKGFGYIEDNLMNDTTNFHDAIITQEDNKDVRSIIKSFVNRKRFEQIINY